MTVTVAGGPGQGTTTLGYSASDLTAIAAAATSSATPIIYGTNAPAVSAYLSVPSSLTSNGVAVSAAGTSLTAGLTTGQDTVTGSPDVTTLSLGGSAINNAPTALSLTTGGSDTVSTLGAVTGTLSNTVSTITGGALNLSFLGSSSGTGTASGSSTTASTTSSAVTVTGGARNALVDAVNPSAANETLTGGAGSNTFDLSMDTTPGSGAGVTDTIANFTGYDTVKLGSTNAVNMALSTYKVVGNAGTFMLPDGTKVVLSNYTAPLTASSFKT